jgi:hypothetical protein
MAVMECKYFTIESIERWALAIKAITLVTVVSNGLKADKVLERGYWQVFLENCEIIFTKTGDL